MPGSHIPRKRFGQHFLHDTAILTQIAQAINPGWDDFVVEIGPGEGALTNEVYPLVNHLHLIEIDRDLGQRILEKYPKEKITLYQEDALQFDFDALFIQKKQPLRVFGNLPYNISTPLLFYLLQFSSMIQDMTFLLQKEVVDRMAALPGTADYGRLSVMVQYACQVLPLFEVAPEAFSPPPKVMSKVVKLIPYQNNHPHALAQNPMHFAKIVNTAFQQRRKTLNNALKGSVTPDAFMKTNIDSKRRPETLSVAEYVALSNLSYISINKP